MEPSRWPWHPARLGVARDALEPAALAASTSSSMKANPVSLSGEQLLEMLEAAWE